MFVGDVVKIRLFRVGGYFVNYTKWTHPSLGFIREWGETDVYLGWISVGWSKAPSPHSIDNAVGTIRGFLMGTNPKSVFLGNRLRDRLGLRVYFNVNAKNWR